MWPKKGAGNGKWSDKKHISNCNKNPKLGVLGFTKYKTVLKKL